MPFGLLFDLSGQLDEKKGEQKSMGCVKNESSFSLSSKSENVCHVVIGSQIYNDCFTRKV